MTTTADSAWPRESGEEASMALTKRLTRNEFGEPVVTITVTGHHDIYRLGWHMQMGQSEFAAIGRQMHESLRRLMGRAGWAAITGYYGGQPRATAAEEIRNAARRVVASVERVADEDLAPDLLALRRAVTSLPKPKPSIWEVA